MAATEKKAQHTPAPWQLETVKTSIGVCHKIGPFPHGRAGTTYACVYDDCSVPSWQKPELLANARLIAKAPRMYDELFRALAVIRNPQAFDTEGVARDIETLLREIEGEA